MTLYPDQQVSIQPSDKSPQQPHRQAGVKAANGFKWLLLRRGTSPPIRFWGEYQVLVGSDFSA